MQGLLAESPTVSEERKGPRTDAPDKAIEGFLRGAGVSRDDHWQPRLAALATSLRAVRSAQTRTVRDLYYEFCGDPFADQKQAERAVARVSAALRVPLARVPAQSILGVVHARRFKKLTGGRAPGEENVKSHYRKGVGGDWVNHMNEEHVAAFKERYGDLVLKLGYETDPGWTLESARAALEERNAPASGGASGATARASA